MSLEKRAFLNLQNLQEYNQSLLSLIPNIQKNVKDSCLIDTTNFTPQDTALEVASQLLPAMRQRSLETIKREYD